MGLRFSPTQRKGLNIFLMFIFVIQLVSTAYDSANAQSRSQQVRGRLAPSQHYQNQRKGQPYQAGGRKGAAKAKKEKITKDQDNVAFDRYVEKIAKGQVAEPTEPIMVGNTRVTPDSFRIIKILGGNHNAGGNGIMDTVLAQKGAGYINLMAGMGLTDLFWALTTNDHEQVKEWWDSMTSFSQFHLNMIEFELGMLMANQGGTAVGNAVFQQYLPYPNALEPGVGFMDAPTNETMALKQAVNAGAMEDAQKLSWKGAFKGPAAWKEVYPGSSAFGVKAFSAFQSALQFAILPIGDMVSSYFAEIYNHPKWQEYRQTFDPHTAVVDPDNPNAPPTLDPAVKAKVRGYLKLHFLNDAIADAHTNAKWTKLFWHGLQLGLVAVGYGAMQSYFITPLEVGVRDGKTTLFYRTTKGGAQITEDIFEAVGKGEATEIFAIKSIRLADFVQSLMGAAEADSLFWFTAVSWVGGVVFNVVGFFILSEIASAILDPVINRYEATKLVETAMKDFHEAIDWYVDPNRTEFYPYANLKEKSTRWYWLHFFLDYKGDLNSAFFKQNTEPNDNTAWHKFTGSWWMAPLLPLAIGVSYFGDDWDNGRPPVGWHWGTQGIETMFWDQAFMFMRDFSLKYLGKPVDESGYNMCNNGNHAASVPCAEAWYYTNLPLFLQNLQNFQTTDYVRSRIQDVDSTFEQYRSNILLGDVTKTWSSWGKDVNTQATEIARQEHYYVWIARGMDQNDPFFVSNDGYWHPDPRDTSSISNPTLQGLATLGFYNPHQDPGEALRDETAKMLDRFDADVLGVPVQGYSDCKPDDAYALAKVGVRTGTCDTRTHAQRVQDYLTRYRPYIKKTDLIPVLQNTYLKLLDDTYLSPEEQEEHATKQKKITSLLDQVNDSDAQRQKQTDMTVRQEHVLRWFLGGMNMGDPDFLKNDPPWHDPVDQNFPRWEADGIKLIIAKPFFLNNSCSTDLEKNQYNGVVKDLWNLLNDQESQISAQNRDYFALLFRTYFRIQQERDEFAQRLAETNNKYLKLIRAKLAPTWFQQHTGQWWNGDKIWGVIPTPNVIDKNTNKFNTANRTQDDCKKAVKSNVFWSLLGPAGGLYGAVNDARNCYSSNVDLPDGTINTFNYEIDYYAKIIQTTLNMFQQQNNFGDAEKQNELMGFAQGADYILDRLERLTDLIETIANDPNSGMTTDNTVFTNMYEASINAALVADLISLSNAPAPGTATAPGEDAGPNVMSSSAMNAMTQISSGVSVNSGPHERAESVRQRILAVTNHYWGDIPGIVAVNYQPTGNQDTDGKALTSELNRLETVLVQHKKSLLYKSQQQLQAVMQAIEQRGRGYASDEDENKLRDLLQNQKFSLPILAASVGTQGLPLFVATVTGAEVVNAENFKSFQARLGCYVIGDALCKQSQ